MDRLAAMRAFVVVAELAGFGSAARRLGVSPAGVTRLVAGLEAQLGAKLLHRTTRNVALTDVGARYLAHARSVIAQIDDADAALRAERADPRGHLVVAAPAVFARRYLVPLMGVLLHRHPSVTSEIVSDDGAGPLDAGIDLAVRIGPLVSEGLVARRIGTTRSVLVASPIYLAERGRPRAPADLARHDVIEIRSAPSATTSVRRRPLVRARHATSRADVAIEHALQGAGLVRVLAYEVRDAIRDGSLEIVMAEHEPPVLPIQLVRSGGRPPSAGVRALVSLVTSACDWTFVDLTRSNESYVRA